MMGTVVNVLYWLSTVNPAHALLCDDDIEAGRTHECAAGTAGSRVALDLRR